ncbi:MAG TPA: acyl-CoA dehydrogenase family protein [Acidimicrobiia bacterium]
MDFALNETQTELVGLTNKILSDRMTPQNLKASERSDDGFDRDTWLELAKANLLGIAIPEEQGGLGLAFLDLCLVLREAGKFVPPMPLIPCIVSGALTVARYGSPDQMPTLAHIADGSIITTVAIAEHGTDARHPYATATPTGDGGYTLTGVKTTVPFADVAAGMLVSARVADSDEIVVLSVHAQGDGITQERQIGQNYEHLFQMTFDNVAIPAGFVIGTAAQGREILEFMLEHTQVAMCALISGVCDAAVRLTAQYTIDRKQFERSIGTFQAVSQRMADAYINMQAIELTMLQAATHLDEGKDVPDEVATAKWWACEGGNQIGHACLHIHGGISIDIDYPIHRYFLWIKQAEFTLGSATAQLLYIGKHLADTPV